MKFRLLVASSITAIIGLVWLNYINSGRTGGMEINERKAPLAERHKVITPKVVTIAPISSVMSKHGATVSSVREDMEILTSVFEYYRRANNGNNPVGLNDEITADFVGRNQRAIAFIDPKHPSVASGVLKDRFGTPYRFHALSSNEMEIRSAGKDKQMFTEDDVYVGTRY